MTFEQIDILHAFVSKLKVTCNAFVPNEHIAFIEDEIVNMNPDKIGKGEITPTGAWYFLRSL